MTAYGILGFFLGVGIALVAIAVRHWPRTRPAIHEAAPVPAPVLAVGYRYCPAELRTRAAVLHSDGTAACLDCTAHIPAGGQ